MTKNKVNLSADDLDKIKDLAMSNWQSGNGPVQIDKNRTISLGLFSFVSATLSFLQSKDLLKEEVDIKKYEIYNEPID